MSHDPRQIVTVSRDAENLTPSFTFLHEARIDKGWVMLFTEGSPGLEAKWVLTQGKDGQTITTEYLCAMTDSYQNFQVQVSNLDVVPGDRFDFSVNDNNCVCHFVLEACAHEWLVPSEEPNSVEEPETPESTVG